VKLVAITDTTATLIAAAAALLGVLIGGLITTGTTWFFERRRDDADLRQARRLVAEELLLINYHFRSMAEFNRYPLAGTAMLLPTQQWEQHRGALARHLDDETWDSLSPFLDSIPATRAVFEREPPATQLSPHHLDVALEGARMAGEYYLRLGGPQKLPMLLVELPRSGT
jgi:hypothetical protein